MRHRLELLTCTMWSDAPVATALASTSCMASIPMSRTCVWIVVPSSAAILKTSRISSWLAPG